MSADGELDLDSIRARLRGVTSLPSAIPERGGDAVRDLIFDALEMLGEIDRLRSERETRAEDGDALVAALYGPDLLPRLTQIVRARHGDAGPADEERAFHLAMAELWREGELRWFPGGGPWPPGGIVYGP